MKNVKKLVALSLVVVLSLAMFVACGSKKAETGETSKSEKNTLVMATNAAFPPYEYVEGDSYEGIDIEIAGKIAEKLGMTLEIKDVEFDSIVAGVESGKFDMGMAGITVTEDRQKSVNFTDSYATGIQAIIVTNDSAITSVDDLSEKTKIGVQQGTTGDIYASEDYTDAAVTRFNKGADAVQALMSGKVDCVIIDNEPAKSFVEANKGLKVLDTEYVQEDYAICVNKSDTELLEKINKALKELQDDGTIDAIIAKYITAE